MTTSCIRSERLATPEELTVLRSNGDVASLGCILVVASPFAVGAYCFFFIDGGPWGVVLGLCLGALVVSIPLSFWRWRLPGRRRERTDAEAGVVEVLTIEGARSVTIPGDHSSVDPAFAFELPNDCTLLLVGQWLTHPDTFGGSWDQWREDDEEAADNYANGLVPPCAFPASKFCLHRFPVSGEVVHIEILGDYAAPEALDVGIDLGPLCDSPSIVVRGSVLELESALAAGRLSAHGCSAAQLVNAADDAPRRS